MVPWRSLVVPRRSLVVPRRHGTWKASIDASIDAVNPWTVSVISSSFSNVVVLKKIVKPSVRLSVLVVLRRFRIPTRTATVMVVFSHGGAPRNLAENMISLASVLDMIGGTPPRTVTRRRPTSPMRPMTLHRTPKHCKRGRQTSGRCNTKKGAGAGAPDGAIPERKALPEIRQEAGPKSRDMEFRPIQPEATRRRSPTQTDGPGRARSRSPDMPSLTTTTPGSGRKTNAPRHRSADVAARFKVMPLIASDDTRS